MEPALPPGVRFAKPDDILRLGIVSFESFIGTDCFDWMWIDPNEFPRDVLASEIAVWEDVLVKGEELLLVIEDDYYPDENSKTSAVIDVSGIDWQAPQPGEKVIVGAISFEPNRRSPRVANHCQTTDLSEYPDAPAVELLALDADHYAQLLDSIKEHKKRLGFENGFNIELLVVHPAYHRRGHARTLVKWMQDLARIDQVTVYVAADGKSEEFYARLGFEVIERLEIPGDEITPEGCRVIMMQWLPGEP
ncbi:hypothetical protein B0T22DRAFT_388307 [Podospora appendiculata]|uniref:N-acetyltransferase domain-containing protein n=1 Tax=Podospora appendiculata TaxID=314037 RepID=A0AAE1C7A7_9PEZI|nr:hypothetical protein B0T22DRAFT_388307 [Podospora appendiculata]